MYRQLFNFVKRKIPKISETEMIALQCGGTFIDRDILKGNINYPKKPNLKNKFDKSKLNNILDNFDSKKIYPNNSNIIYELANNKFFSFLINEEYGDIKLYVNEISEILTKITSTATDDGGVPIVANS